MSRSEYHHERALHANLIGRGYAYDHPEVVRHRRAMQVAKLAEHVSQVVAEAPPLTAEQVKRLTSLVRGGKR
ncbi:hypothetical protein [Intrasporangium sp. DVR]|uniref:hypothetical protein n=1 Tax=Intrasporangium sp. DVR TaxID=3127867 RepID=UPI00313A6653